MSEPPVIEHNPNERRQSNAIWWFWWTALPALWVGYLSFFEFDWPSMAIGALTTAILIIWVTEKTGNKVPDSWRR